MPEHEPGGTVRRTGWQTLGVAAVAGAGIGWLLFDVPERFGLPLPPLPLIASIVIGLLAVSVGFLAWTTHRKVQVRREPIMRNRAVAILALGKACLIAGVGLAFGYGSVIVFFLHRLAAELARERVISAVVAAVAATGLAVAGGFLERACMVPGPPSGDATPKDLPRSPSSPD